MRNYFDIHSNSKITEWLLVALFLFPVLPLNITNIIFIAFSTCSIGLGILSYKFVNWKMVLLPYIISLPFIPYTIEYFCDPHNALMQIEFLKKLQFLFAPLAFGIFFSGTKFNKQNYLINAFTISITAIALYALARLIFTNELFLHENYLNGAFLIRQKFEMISHLHPTYFGMFATISIFWLIVNLFAANNKFRVFNIISLLILLVLEVLVAAKAPFFITIIGSVWLVYKKSGSIKKFAGLTTLILSASIILVVISPSLKNRMNELQDFFVSEKIQDNTINQRQLIMSCNMELFREHFWFGTGAVNSQKYLNTCYQSKNELAIERTQFNSHNQYFTLGINYGIVTLLFFLFSIYWILKKAKGNDFYMISILSLILVMLSESILERQMGTYTYILFALLIICHKKQIIN